MNARSYALDSVRPTFHFVPYCYSVSVIAIRLDCLYKIIKKDGKTFVQYTWIVEVKVENESCNFLRTPHQRKGPCENFLKFPRRKFSV